MRRAMLLLLVTLSLTLCLTSNLAPADLDPLDPWYRGYNETYFNNELPQTVIISHNLTDDTNMAITTPLTNGYYHIDFNPKFGYHTGKGTSITELRNLFHEMCHVEIFVEGTVEFDDHGPHWEGCMHRLAIQKALDNLW